MARVKNLLILHAGALGDCALTLHLIAAIKAAWGNPPVTLAARSSLAQWARKRGLVTEACSLDRLQVHALYGSDQKEPAELLNELRRYDFVVSLLAGPDEPVSRRLASALGERLDRIALSRTSQALRASPCPASPGELKPAAPPAACYATSKNVLIAVDPKPTEKTLGEGAHITQQWADELARAGYPLAGIGAAELSMTAAKRRELKERLAKSLGVTPGRLALCHPGSGGLSKCCSIEFLEEALGSLAYAGWQVGWMIGPDEVERFGESYVDRLERTANVTFEESVERAADLVCGADLYIGHDTGMTHVAALAGARTIALFGPTDARVWSPLGPRVRIARFPSSGEWFGAWTGEQGYPDF